jgi:hypothetical protein
MEEYQIIDNYLPQKEFNDIKDVIMSNNFSWYYSPDVAEEKIFHYSYYFAHLLYINNKPNSAHYDIVQPLINKINPHALIRIKANLYPNLNKVVENLPHVDFEFDHKGAIYYINTNDGFTVLHDGTKIQSIENRILFFNPSKLHHSTHCTDQKARVNINFNYF